MIATQGQQLWVQWQHLKFKPIMECCVFASAHGSPTIVETTHSHGYRRCNIWVRVARTEKELRTIDMSGGLVPIVVMVQLPGDLQEEEVTEEDEHRKTDIAKEHELFWGALKHEFEELDVDAHRESSKFIGGVKVELEELEGEDTREIEELSGIVKEEEIEDSIGKVKEEEETKRISRSASSNRRSRCSGRKRRRSKHVQAKLRRCHSPGASSCDL